MRERTVGRRQQREVDGFRFFSSAEGGTAESDVLRQCGVRGARGPAGNPVPRIRLRRLESRSHPLYHGP